MKILITGATGFIGTPLSKELSKKHELVILSRKNWNVDVEMPPMDAFDNVDAVVHLLGENIAAKRWTADRKKKILDSRIESTKKLTQAIREYSNHNIKTFVCASAIGYYGDRKDEMLFEENVPGTGFLAEVCVDWEKHSGQVPAGIRVVNVRTGFVIGNNASIAKLISTFKLGLGGKVGSGKQWMSWIHLSDIVQLFVFCLENAKVSGPVNGTAPNPVRNQEFTEVLAHVLHRPAVFTVPAFALKFAMGELSSLLLASERVFPKKATECGFSFQFPKLEAAFQDLL